MQCTNLDHAPHLCLREPACNEKVSSFQADLWNSKRGDHESTNKKNKINGDVK